jgi:FtsP/CotA-like multicopper oxidase with cupredoxin domain
MERVDPSGRILSLLNARESRSPASTHPSNPSDSRRIDRRSLLKLTALAAGSLAASRATAAFADADYSLEIGPCSLEVAPHRFLKTIAYNGQVPGPLLRLKEDRNVTIDVTNNSPNNEVVHWHGLFLPSAIDGSMEECTPHIPPGGHARYTFTPQPAGFRWFHTHTMAGKDMSRGLYSGQYGLLLVEPKENPARYDREFFLELHDWNGQFLGSDDGAMDPVYNTSTINGKTLGFGEPLRVKAGEQVMLHLLNSSATDLHWIALAGHSLRIVALDGNPVPQQRTVPMLRLAPAERVCAIVEMNNPGVWILGEVRRHIQSAGMGIVVEYEGRNDKPRWDQPQRLDWNYTQFASADPAPSRNPAVIEVPLRIEEKFMGHGSPYRWTINGRSFPETESLLLKTGQRYRLIFDNRSHDDHPLHLHRHLFDLRRIAGGPELQGVMKDTVLVDSGTQVEVEFTADHPGPTLLHCHQQSHMDMGFMMVLRYA